MRNLKNSVCPDSTRKNFVKAKRRKILSRLLGTGRTYAELKKQRMSGQYPKEFCESEAKENSF